MKTYNPIILMIIVLLTLFTQACAATTSANETTETTTQASSQPARRIVIYNWADYIDPEFYPEFKTETGIEVVEDNFASFEELLAKLQGGATGYALIVADSRTVSILKEQGMLAKLDHDNVPNLANLYQRFRTLPFDLGNEYCATYQWGTTGLGYNADAVETPTSWAALFEPDQNMPAYGRMTMLDDVREAFAAALIYRGYDVNTTDEAQLRAAQQVLIKAKAGLAGYDSVTYYSLIGAGENLLAHSWNGDILRAMDQNPDGANLSFVVPQEGGVAWVDSLCIPNTVTPEQKLAAESFINFLLRPDIGARLSERNFFASPNQAAEAFLDEAFLNDPTIYPPAEIVGKLQYLMPLGEAEAAYQRLWDEVKASTE